jgi:very-short-patch-repair endonuclease
VSLRFTSLDCLGKGGWRVSASSPFVPQVLKEEPPLQPVTKKARTPRTGPTPEDLLWCAAMEIEGAVREFSGAVPDRKFRIDIAFPAEKLAVEIDGWEWHGKHKGDFTRDRERQNLLTLNGWRILRFTAGQIRENVSHCISQIKVAKVSQ